ncbi:MAG: ATP-binding protein [Thermoplasmata archaeon]
MTAPTSPPAPVEAPTWWRVGRSYRAPLFIRQFPPEVPFGFLGRILPTSETLELSVEAHRIPSSNALEMLHGARAVAEAELASGGNGGQTAELEVERASAEDLGHAIARRTQELWKVGIRFVALGPTRPHVEAKRTRLSERLSAIGFRLRIPRYEVREALLPADLSASEPRPDGYWHTLPTDGLAALFPFGDETLLESGGVLLGLALSDASPVFVDRWSHASHSWGIFGTTGAGKSFAAALCLLRTRWLRPDVSIAILDPLGEYSALVEALGGSVIRVADGAGGRLNPLDPVTTRGDRREKAARVGTMLRALFPSLRDEEAAELDAAVTQLYDRGPEVPTFRDLGERVVQRTGSSTRLSTLLEVFQSGSLRALDGLTTARPTEKVVSVDFEGVPDDQLPFHLTYVLDWAYGRLADRQGGKLLLIDEAHLLARHAATEEFLDRVVRHVRHFEAGLLILSQSPEDFLVRPAGRSLLRNLYATGFLRLPEVSAEARTFFGLTGAEAEWLPRARLPRETGYSESLWRFGELHLPLALVASTPEYEFLAATLGRHRAGTGETSAAPKRGL